MTLRAGAALRPRRHWKPRISVIVASYRWPEALRTSLDAALAQTIEALEVLVVEDGPDRASRTVVRETNDPRVQWTHLRRGTGSQSGPNTKGWRRARAPIVAYLGHDDLWHPEHLERLVSTLETSVETAHAITLCLDADDDEPLLVAGTTPWEPSAFAPPSSLAHWRDSPRMGQWISPGRTGMPVDYAFLMAAHARGARFAASGAPTVFKYPATWRRDSYRTRDAGPQQRLHGRLKADPGLGAQLLRRALASGRPGDMPAPPVAPPGAIHDYNRRLKGLAARFGPRTTCWMPGGFDSFPGWHPAERDTHGSFAWTGSEDRALVRLDSPGDGELGVRIVVRHTLTSQQLEDLRIDVDGADVALTQTPGPGRVAVFTGWLGRKPRNHTIEVGLSTTTALATTVNPQSKDERMLGVAVSEIALLTRAR